MVKVGGLDRIRAFDAPAAAVAVVEMAVEWLQIGWWHVRRVVGWTCRDDRPPPRGWTAPQQPRKPGW
jgi:hypothetical protein